MSRYAPPHDSVGILAAAQLWKERCLQGDGSAFSPESIWTIAHVDSLYQNFVLSPDASDLTFLEKLEKQLEPTEAAAKKLAAEMIWLILLCASNVTAANKRLNIRTIWEWSGDPLPESDLLSDSMLSGVGSAGLGINTYRWKEFVFLIELVRTWKSAAANVLPVLEDGEAFAQWLDRIPGSSHRQLRYMLMFLLFPDDHERIFSRNDRRNVLKGFEGVSSGEFSNLSAVEVDHSLLRIRKREEGRLGTSELDFYRPPLVSQWRSQDSGLSQNPSFVSGDVDSFRVWVEKTIVSGRLDRESGEDSLGKALWSPQKSKNGADIYRFMREVRPGDVIIHFVDNQGVFGVSHAAAAVDNSFQGVSGTAWEGPGYRIALTDYIALQPKLARSALFSDPEIADQLKSLAETSKNLFFSSALDLNQGAYLTPASQELVAILQQAYEKQSGKPIPYLPGPKNDPGRVETSAMPSQSAVYTLEDMVRETSLDVKTLAEWLRTLKRKRQIVLQGPPGTGKTFVATCLARVLCSSFRGVVELVQFHPAYAYEDFILGLRPITEASGPLRFKPTPGTFVRFCESARRTPAAPCVLIIDEMNRANLSRVFGELMYLLEYRNKEIPLAGGEAFSIPGNVYIIGTMNTADRSIAVVDHALRRRFAFLTLGPQYEALTTCLKNFGLPAESLIGTLKAVNSAIDDPNYAVGTAFFLNDGAALKEALPSIWQNEIEPYLEEYFFDHRSKVEEFRWDHLKAGRLADWV